MRLCDLDIKRYVQKGKIQITPLPDEHCFNGASVDISLGNSFRVFNDHLAPFIDLSGSKKEIEKVLNTVMGPEIILPPDQHFFVHPGELVLAVTQESITLAEDMVGWLDGRSSLARLGLMVHVTAHRIDPGWSGKIVLEFFNGGKLPLALKAGMKIGAVSFELLSGQAERPYNKRSDAKYKTQENAIGSRIGNDHHT